MKEETASLVNPLTQQPIRNEELQELSILVADAKSRGELIKLLEDKLKAENTKLQELITIKIPDTMGQLGLAEIKLASGEEVVVEPFYSAKIPEDKTEQAFAWLRETNNDSIIKTEVKSVLGKGEQEKVKKLVALLTKANLPFNKKEGVHPQTLKSFVREQIEDGKPLPLDLFGVYIGKRAKIQ